MGIAQWVSGESVLTGRLARLIGLGGAVAAAATLFGGCTERRPADGPVKKLQVASRTDVAIAVRTGRPTPTPLCGVYIGDIIAVTGYDFAPVATDNRVTIGGVACPVLSAVELSPNHELGPFRALYIEVRSDVPAGPAQPVALTRPALPSDNGPEDPITLGPKPERIAPSAPTTVAVHRLAFATPAQGNVVHAVDLTANPPAWIAPRDLAVTAPPSAATVSADGRFVLFANGRDLQIITVADGGTALHVPAFFNGPVGPMALSRDGRLLAAGVFPPGKPPEVVVADLSWLGGLNFNVIAGTGLLVPGKAAPAAPSRIAVGLGGAAPGGVTFNAAGTELYATLSSGVVRVWRVAPQSIPAFSHELAMPPFSAPFGIALTPDDRLALVTEISSGLLIPVETADGATQSPLLIGATPIGPVLAAGGTQALVADVTGRTLRVFHTTTNPVSTSQPTLSLGFHPIAAAAGPEGLGGTPGRSTVVLIDGNRLRFVEAAAGSGALTLHTGVVGPFPNGLRLLAVTPAR
jgi:hypothetical protein